VSPLKDTFFERVKISFEKTFKLMSLWYWRIPVSQACKHAEVTKKTAVDFYSFCREAATVAHTHDEEQVGSGADIVEVDESHLFTPKYHRGRPLRRALWVFGGISRLNRRMFVVQIRNKQRRTLFPLMQKHIAQNIYIISDEHRSYLTCAILGFKGHANVNHSVTYVRARRALVRGLAPNLGQVRLPYWVQVKVHTNNIERHWRSLKACLKTCRNVDMVPNYIGEFLYRHNTLRLIQADGAKFARFIQDVVRVYPGPNAAKIQVDDCECDECQQ